MARTKISLTKLGLTALAALIVSACGSSSGGGSSEQQQNNASNNNQTSQPTNNSQNNASNQSSNQSQQKNNASNNNQVSQPTNNSQNNASNQSSNQSQQTRNGTGAARVVSGEDGKISVTTKTINGYDTTKINVEGTEVVIGYPGFYAGSWFNTNTSTSEITVCCGKYSDVRFGVNDSYDKGAYIFYNGNPTKNMPTSGTANYVGEAIITTINVPQLDEEDHYQGESKFNVDFGNKTLNGSLDIPNIQAININAKISGNSFTGTANSASLSSGNVEGKFYGDNAKEMAGIVQSGRTWGAAFGAAKKQ